MSRAVHFAPTDVRCCGAALKYVDGCVCRYIVVCPYHGTRHHGGHS